MKLPIYANGSVRVKPQNNKSFVRRPVPWCPTLSHSHSFFGYILLFVCLLLEYHRMIGFETFYLLNNDSTDDTQCILDAYTKRGIVVPMNHLVQEEHHVFDKCVEQLLREQEQQQQEGAAATRTIDLSNTWMATHDVDEFIWFRDTSASTSSGRHGSSSSSSSSPDAMIPSSFSLQNAVHNLQERHGGGGGTLQSLFIPRFLFGSSGYNHHQSGLVIQHYTHRFDPTGCSSSSSDSDRDPGNSSSRTTFHTQDDEELAQVQQKQQQQEQQRQERRRLTIAFERNSDNGGGGGGNGGRPTSFCNPRQNVTTAYHGAGKGMSLVAALALDCRPHQNATKSLGFCQGTHFHKLRNASNPTGPTIVQGSDWERNPTTLGDVRYVGDADIVHDMAIMHYMTRSREEFYQRTCASRWIEKYQRCIDCSPETYFNLSETYTNNFVDERMAPFAQRLAAILSSSDSSSSSSSSSVDLSHCHMAPPKTKPWQFYRNCWNRKKGKKKPKSQS
jgi:hypothetical protein